MELQCALACPPVLRRRSTIAVMVAAALALPVAGPHAGAETDDDAAERAAAEIFAARERANDAAAAYFDALSELDQLEDEAKRLAADGVELERRVDALRDQVEQVAVNRFMSSGNAGIPLLSGVRAPRERLQAEVLVGIVTDSSAEAMDEFERARLELEANQQAVEDNQEAVEEQKEEFLALQEQAEAEVVHLQEVERQRLEDERVREALEARRREEQRQREAEAERQRQEAAETQSTAVPSAPAPEPDQGGGDARPTGGGSPPAENGDGDDPLPAAPEPDPEPGPEPSPPSGGMVCPVAGASSYSDTYGAARSGGRSHEGVDLIAPAGTPLVAVVSGSVEFGSSPLGGNSLWLHGSDGNAYFYAHLSGFEGSSRDVSQGEVIGYVGSTGNANGTNHLHFEVHPGGGSSVNPYPYVVNAGC
jgi:peptidoglycan LD-endopeptidase LytH